MSTQPFDTGALAKILPSAAEVRRQTEASLLMTKISLEALRIREVSLRAELVESLNRLKFDVEIAAFKLGTRQFADGHACIDVAFDTAKAGETALVSVLEEIAYLETEVADIQRDLDDAALWSEVR